MLSLILAASLGGLLKSVLLATLAALNAVLALLASISIWKAYLVTGVKVGLILLTVIPVVGILIYVFWGQRFVHRSP